MRRLGLARRLHHISDYLPRRYPLNSSLQNQPIFVFGSGRNGSTLLNQILNQHPSLFLPPEQNFLGQWIIKFKLYNFLNWRDLSKVLIGDLLPGGQAEDWEFDSFNVFRKALALNPKTLDILIDLVYKTYGNEVKSSFYNWGDTTPQNTPFVREIYEVFPEAKFIFLIRDGRDVVASYKKAGQNNVGRFTEVPEASKLWLESIVEYEWLSKKTNVHSIRYEELVAKPSEVIETLCNYLEIEFMEKMIGEERPLNLSKLYAEPQHGNLSNPINSSSIGNYFDVLEPDDLKYVSEHLNNALERYKYPVS